MNTQVMGLVLLTIVTALLLRAFVFAYREVQDLEYKDDDNE